MCIQTTLQSKIARLTQDGELIAQFLADTLQGAIPDAKVCHRMDAAKLLAKYGPTHNITPFNPTQNLPAPSEGRGSEGCEDNNPHHPVHPVNSENAGEAEISPLSPSTPAPTLRDIVAYPIARYIRQRTDNGETALNALCDIMQGGSYSAFEYEFGNPSLVKPYQRLAAAKELMSRAFGEARPPRAESSTPVRSEIADGQDPVYEFDKNDPANSRIARLVRDMTNNGVDAAETMIRIVENEDADEWKPAHRLIAAKELLHRAYDFNYEAVTLEHLEAYRKATEDLDARKRVDFEHARRQAGLLAIIKEYDEACAADDEEAMKAAEKKYADYAINGDAPDLDDPADADPTLDYYRSLAGRERQAKLSRQLARGITPTRRTALSYEPSIAAAIRAPKLTVPLHNRSP